MKKTTITFRVTEEFKRGLKDAARKKGVTDTDYFLRAVFEKIVNDEIRKEGL